MDEKLLEIKNCIEKYLKDGNNLYVPAKSLPFYEKINTYRRWFNRSTGKRITMQEIFLKCGIIYDKEYDDFLKLKEKIDAIAKKDGIDAIKKDRSGKNTVMSDLKLFATKYNCNYADYLFVMMGYKLKKLNAKTNYLEHLKNELEIAYPDHNLNGIKRANPKLYEKISYVKRYSHQFATTKEVIYYLGFYIEKGKNKSDITIDKNKALIELANLYPDKIVANLSKKDDALYHRIAKLSAKEGKSISQFLKENGFEYTTFCLSTRLTNTYIDAEMYYKKLNEKLSKFYKNKQVDNLNDYERYKLNLSAFLNICANKNNEKESQI